MATSSITHNFVIKDKEKVEAFADAIEEMANSYIPVRKTSARQITDPNEIKALMQRVKERRVNG